MDIISKSKEITKLLKEFKDEYSTLSKELSKVDIEISNYQHLFECCKFPAHIRAKLNKEHDTLLKKRRDIKLQMAQLENVKASVIKYEVPNESKIKSAGTFKFKLDGFTKVEKEMYEKYILPQYK